MTTKLLIEKIVVTAAEGGIAYVLSSNIAMSAGVAAALSLIYNLLRESAPTGTPPIATPPTV